MTRRLPARDHGAFDRALGPVLNQGGHGHDEEAAGKTVAGEEDDRSQGIGFDQRQGQSGEAHSQCAEWDQAILNFFPGEVAGGEAAQADPNRDRGHEIPRHLSLNPSSSVPKGIRLHC